jgi:hypothetical protein
LTISTEFLFLPGLGQGFRLPRRLVAPQFERRRKRLRVGGCFEFPCLQDNPLLSGKKISEDLIDNGSLFRMSDVVREIEK